MLSPNNPLQRNCGIVQLDEPVPWLSLDPILHVGFVANVLVELHERVIKV